jgi:hypothetical protein
MNKAVLGLVALGALAMANGPVMSQTFQNGPYYANPSWDQKIPTAQRFIVLTNWNNEAVLDRETGLVWERSPLVHSDSVNFFDAVGSCYNSNTGDRQGWRLPTPEELASLIDRTQQPRLPAGHPFQNVSPGMTYWTASTFSASDLSTPTTTFGDAFAVDFFLGPSVHRAFKDFKFGAWCVRGGPQALSNLR